MALEADSQDKEGDGTGTGSGKAKDKPTSSLDRSLTHAMNSTKDKCVGDTDSDTEKFPKKDQSDNNTGGKEEKGGAGTEEIGEGHKSENGDTAKETPAGSDLDPLSVDLYDKLRSEGGVDTGDAQWADYSVCDDLQSACKRLSCTEKQF